MSLKSGLKALLDSASITAVPVRIGRKPKGSATEESTIILRVIASTNVIDLQGVNPLQMRRVQLDCWASNPKDLEAMITGVHAALDGYVGTLSEGTGVQACLPSGDVDLDDETLRQVGAALDFSVWYAPATS